MTEWQN